MPCFGLLAPCSFVDEENIGVDLKSKTDGLPLSASKFNGQALMDLLYMFPLKPFGRRGCPGTNLRRGFGVLHLD